MTPSEVATTQVFAAQGSLAERSLKLGNDQILHFTLDCVPDPPAISFANDIPALDSMWDFKPGCWQGRSVLSVKGHPIPVAYWPELYRYGKKDQWKGMKTRWFEWKV
jgi:hypothetical protein